MPKKKPSKDYMKQAEKDKQLSAMIHLLSCLSDPEQRKEVKDAIHERVRYLDSKK